MASNITWQTNLSLQERVSISGRRGFTIWLTGLPGSGKSTIASSLERCFLSMGLSAYKLDGDNIRHGLNRDLGFSAGDRHENIRRMAEVAKLFADSGAIAVVACISPSSADRQMARDFHAGLPLPGGKRSAFVEIFVDVPLHIAEERDPKGLYKRARSGEIPNFTGVSATYEQPLDHEIHVRTNEQTVDESVNFIISWLASEGFVDPWRTVLKG